MTLSECVVTDAQCQHLARSLSLPSSHPGTQQLQLNTVFVLQQQQQDQSIDTANHFVEALSGLSDLSVRIVLKRDIFEGYLDAQTNLFLELFRKIDQNKSRIDSLDLDSQVLQDIPADLFSSALSKIETINLTEASVSQAQVTALVCRTKYLNK